MMICFLFFVFHSSYLLQAREHAFFFSNLQRGSNQNLEIFKTQEIKAESKAWHRQINPEHPNKQIGRQRLLQNSISLCGNNVIETLEECDDGNMVSGDGCSISCTYQCGDGNLNSLLQQCDDGNRVSGDGCSSTCKTENMNPRSALIIGASIVTIFLASLLIAIQWLSKKKAQKSSKSEKEVQRINKVQIQCETKIKMAIYSQSHSHCRMMVS